MILSPEARSVLELASWLASAVPIPVALLIDEDAVGELVSCGLLVYGPGAAETVTIAEDIQRTTRSEDPDAGRVEAVLAMQSYLGEPESDGVTARAIALLPHAKAWTKATDVEDDVANVFIVLNRISVVLLEIRMGTAALPLAERAARSVEKHTHPDHGATLSAMSNLASVYDQIGEHKRAIRLLEKVIERYKATMGPDHPSVWSSAGNLGAMYMSTGQYTKAAEVLSGVISYRERTLGEFHRETLQGRANMAVILEKEGRQAEALAMREELLPLFEAHLAHDDEYTFILRRNLIRERMRSPASDDARDSTGAAVTEAADASEAAEVPEPIVHPAGTVTIETVGAQVEHATALRNAGRYTEAESAFLEAIEQGGAHLGHGNPVVVSARYRLAMTHHFAKRPEPAIAWAREALAHADRDLGRTHAETAMAAGVLLTLLLSQGDKEYEALLEDRITEVVEALGFRHPLVRTLAARRAAITLGHPDWR